jgi:hypothetical protein
VRFGARSVAGTRGRAGGGGCARRARCAAPAILLGAAQHRRVDLHPRLGERRLDQRFAGRVAGDLVDDDPVAVDDERVRDAANPVQAARGALGRASGRVVREGGTTAPP